MSGAVDRGIQCGKGMIDHRPMSIFGPTDQHGWWCSCARVYAVSVGLIAGVATFLAINFGFGNAYNWKLWLDLLVYWFLVGLPVLLITSALSVFVFRRYSIAGGRTRKILIVAANTSIIVVAMSVGIALAGMSFGFGAS